MKNKPTKLGIIAFSVHMLTNLLWFPIFFIAQNPLGAFIDINLMIITLIWVMYEFKKRSVTSTLLLVPYLAWVLFATFLNWEVVRLNAFSNI
jgi:tryptophan-rich sensory protein